MSGDSPWTEDEWWTEERQVFARHEFEKVNVQANEVCATRLKE